MRVPGYSAELGVDGGCRKVPAHCPAQRGLQWLLWAVIGCGTAYMVKGPSAPCT